MEDPSMRGRTKGFRHCDEISAQRHLFEGSPNYDIDILMSKIQNLLATIFCIHFSLVLQHR